MPAKLTSRPLQLGAVSLARYDFNGQSLLLLPDLVALLGTSLHDWRSILPLLAERRYSVRLAVEGRPEFTDPLPLGGGYLAALLGGRFVVVDVRRARERILYEDYLKMLGNGSSVSQQLLFPERLVLSGDEYALLEENAVEFASLGFDIDFAGEGTIEVKGTPADMPADAVDQMVYDLLQAFSTPVSLADQRREKIAAVMARGGAKGIPRNMSRDEAAALLAQLTATGNFSFSPSGKAITAEITPEDIRTKLG